MNPSTEQLLRAVEGLAAEEIVILPNNSNILLTAQQVDVLTEKRICVVGSTSVPQGIGAILAFNYQADLDTNAKTMEQATKNIQTIEVTRAIRSAQVNGLTVEAGQAIGLINGKLTSCSAELNEVIEDALSTLNADDFEIVTHLLRGEHHRGRSTGAPERAGGSPSLSRVRTDSGRSVSLSLHHLAGVRSIQFSARVRLGSEESWQK